MASVLTAMKEMNENKEEHRRNSSCSFQMNNTIQKRNIMHNKGSSILTEGTTIVLLKESAIARREHHLREGDSSCSF